MKKLLISGMIILATVVLSIIFGTQINQTIAEIEVPFDEKEPDIPAILQNAKSSISKEEFLMERFKGAALRRGISEDKPVDPKLRSLAIDKMEKQEETLLRRIGESEADNALAAAWTPIGPAPLVTTGGSVYSGRTISIAVHPTNPNIVYVGAAQGGLYRSIDGGANWTPLMDSAESIAIGAIAIAPTDPETVYIGTGEHNFSLDSFFGVGVYRIDNASTTATLTGPLNKDAGNNDIFTGRGISRIIVHPTDANTIFVSTTSGVGGIGGSPFVFPSRGIYRSTNATTVSPTFAKLTGLAGNINASVRDIAIDPNDPNILVAGLVASGGTGGIYRSTDALSANPTFTQTQVFNSNSTSELTAEFAAIHPAGDTNATFYAAVGNGGGRVLISTDGGATWTQQIDNNFCSPQCFYDIAIAVNPTNVNNLYLGGAPALIAGVSTNGGTSFNDTGSSSGVHVDTHALAVAPSNPSTIYLGTDGGIYKSTNSGASWQHLNNNQYFATQFMSIATHPTDPDFTIGGTQDNGTLFYNGASGLTWTRVIGGDGGYAQIDQNAPDTTNVRQYHTFFSRTNLQLGYATRGNVNTGFFLRGCFNNSSANGINCNDTAVLFYAPLERGPGNPNSIYYGTDRLYRTGDEGLNHTVVSQAPISSGVPISAIGISPQNDNVRVVGLANGQLMGTSTGSTTLDDLDPTNTVPDGFIARAVVDPNNQTTAYITLSNFGVNNVFKTTNLNANPPTWTNASGSGGTAIPQVPVSAFVVDPQNSNTLYAGTDIGVYVSTDGGTNWNPFGTGLPRAAVFGMSIANGDPRKLRVATHGKGMFEISLAPGLKAKFDYDGDSKTDISIYRPNLGQWWVQQSSNLVTVANTFGISSDTITPADFTGDGKTDIAFFRPGSGEWFVLRSEDSTFFAFPFGANGDIPAPGDYDGDGKADAAVFRPSSATWFINNSGGGITTQVFGLNGDQPIPGDYDGDGKDDIAIFRPSLSEWFYQRSSDLGVLGFAFGTGGDRALPNDFTGDGKTDIAFFRPSSGNWFVLRSEDATFFAFPFGTGTDIPSPGDYDGDGKTDAAVFRPSSNTWFINGSQSGIVIQAFGATGDVPTPNAYVR